MVAEPIPMMAEERAPYTVDSNSPPSPPIPMRRNFTAVDNDLLDTAMGELSGAAWKVVCYLVRHTTGFWQDQARLSLSHICGGTCAADGSICEKGTGLSRRAAILAIQELLACGMIITDAGEVSRTVVRTYRLAPPSAWHFQDETAKTSAKNALVGGGEQTSAEIALDGLSTSAKNALAVPKTSAKNAPIRKIYRRSQKKDQRETNVSTADAVATAPLAGVPLTSGSSEPDEDGAASCSQGIYEIPTRLQVSGSEPLPRSAAPSPASPARAVRKPAKAPTEPRKLTEDQQYRYALLTAVSEALDGAKTPNWGRDWKAAGWFYTKAQQHPASIEAVVACYREMKQVPDWQVEYLHLDILTRRFDAYQKNPVNFHAWVVKQIKTDEWVRRKQQEEATGRPARPYPADAANTSVASTPDTIPVLDIAAENQRKMAEYEAGRRQNTASVASVTQARVRQFAQRAGRGTGADTTTEGGDPTW